MDSTYLSFFILMLWVVYALLIAYVLIKRRGFHERIVKLLLIYLLVSILWHATWLLYDLGFWVALENYAGRWLSFTGFLVLALLFFLTTIEYLPIHLKRQRFWVSLAVGWTVGLSVLALLTWFFSESLTSIDNTQITRDHVMFALLILGWTDLFGGAFYLTIKAYRSVTQPQHKNRIIYWGIALALTVFGDVLLFNGYLTMGSTFQLAGLIVAAYGIMIHDLADLMNLGLKTFRIFIVGLLAAIIYSAIIASGFFFYQIYPGSDISLIVALMALVLAFLINPLLNLFGKWLGRLIFGGEQDIQTLVHEYNVNISNIVELDILSQSALDLIEKEFNIKRSYLLLVDRNAGYTDLGHIRLRGVGGKGAQLSPITIHDEDPLGIFFCQEHRPLAQYDLDFLSTFQNVSAEVRAWFSDLDMDVFVPIYSEDKWIGLFALGPKASGERFSANDLTMLSTLADSTSAALVNARLFDHMKELNSELEKARQALEVANQQLLELDQAKSNFISVITHELRTPVANISFSLQLVEMYGMDNLLPEQKEQLRQISAGIKTTKTMVDNLITIAAFLNKQVVLNLVEIDGNEMIQFALTPLIPKAKEKEIMLHVDIVGDLLPVIGDSKHLENAIYQLIDNAVKFTNPGGHVWVRSWTTSEEFFFDVRDTGPGVPRERLPALWDEFNQIADPLRRTLEGLGLGLALVKYIVTAHSGKVWVESQEGKGSDFGFKLPLDGPRDPSLKKENDFIVSGDVPKPQRIY